MTNPTFALSPAAVNKDQFRDYTDKKQIAIFDQASQTLFPNEADRFDVKPSKVQNLLDRVHDRAKQYHITVINVPKDETQITA